jgi:uncharacterized protein YndB with AHSA1/START domain
VDVTAEVRLDAPTDRVWRTVADLATYPAWLSIVHRAEPEPTPDAEGRPAWRVELRGRIGPLARSKRLRMVRTEADPGRAVRFERVEQDGHRHAAWVMEAHVAPDATAPPGAVRPVSLLVVRLRYAGSFGTGLLERALRDEIERGRERLATALSG